MDKYIGFDVYSKKTTACVVQKCEKDRYRMIQYRPHLLGAISKPQVKPHHDFLQDSCERDFKVQDTSTGNLFDKWCIQLVRRRFYVLRYVKNLC
jgi:hypothetical protein